MTRLDEIGERRLIDGLFSRRYKETSYNFGDDCALLLNVGDDAIVASTDPAPQPVAWELGFQDYFHWGWLLAACNLSDLGAAGAEPIGMLSSLTLPNSMEIDDLTRFLDGLDQCCNAYNCRVIGGNIKEGNEFRCEATVVGRSMGGPPLSRKGASVGDSLVAIGNSGYFWSAVLALKNRFELTDELLSSLVRPVPQLRAGIIMRSRRLVHSSTDASDGLYYAIHCLTVSHGLGFRIEPEGIEYSQIVLNAARSANVGPLRLILGFGDMQLVCAVPKEHLETVKLEAEATGGQCLVLGTVTETGRLEVICNEGTFELEDFDNERLSVDSQFTAGLNAYEHRLLCQPLIKDGGTQDGLRAMKCESCGSHLGSTLQILLRYHSWVDSRVTFRKDRKQCMRVLKDSAESGFGLHLI